MSKDQTVLHDKSVKLDRMRYTKDKFSANLILIAILLDALYFVSIYQSDVQSYYYNWKSGASIVYNLLFLLCAFLCSEGVKSRKTGYTGVLIFIGLMQFVRVFYLPAQAHAATLTVDGVDTLVMGNKQYYYVVICLIVSGVCCLLSAVNSFRNNKALAGYMANAEKLSA